MIRIFLAASLLSIAAAGCAGEDDAETSSSEVASGVPAEARKLRSQIGQFCGACHAFPEPKSFPRSMWGKLVREGYGFYVQSQRSDLDVPIVDDVIAFYESQAPEYFDLPLPQQVPDSGPLKFRAEFVSRKRSGHRSAVSWLQWLRGDASGAAADRLMICDMRSGDVSRAEFGEEGIVVEDLARLSHPAHVEVCDLDGDGHGHEDLLVSELGSFSPADHDKGAVVLMRLDPASGEYARHVLHQKMGRVADARGGFRRRWGSRRAGCGVRVASDRARSVARTAELSSGTLSV